MSPPAENAVKSEPDNSPGVVNSDFARQTELKKDKIDQTPGLNQQTILEVPATKRRPSMSVNQTNLHPHGVA